MIYLLDHFKKIKNIFIDSGLNPRLEVSHESSPSRMLDAKGIGLSFESATNYVSGFDPEESAIYAQDVTLDHFSVYWLWFPSM